MAETAVSGQGCLDAKSVMLQSGVAAQLAAESKAADCNCIVAEDSISTIHVSRSQQ